MKDGTFSAADVRQLHDQGISVEEGQRQIERLARPPRYLDVQRPCTVGDGIVRLAAPELDDLCEHHAAAAHAGRFVKFVPASGAATRMFAGLGQFHEGPGRGTDWTTVVARADAGDARAAELVTFLAELPRFAFHARLELLLRSRGLDLGALAAAGSYAPILDGLLGPQGLDYARKAKGLIEFHRYAAGSRTALEEQLVESRDYVRDGRGVSRSHFTVARSHRAAFEAAARTAAERLAADGTRLEVSWSTQRRSTDTLTLDATGRPLRDDAGRLVFRAGGHGALLEDLEEIGADLAFIKNIDNVQRERADSPESRWKRVLGGYIVRLQREVFRLLDELRGPQPAPGLVDEARALVRERLQADLGNGRPTAEAAAGTLVALLNRPLRVCGVVRYGGEPGGGPFWVRGADGRSTLQIVEASQVDPADGFRERLFASSTHFNPVDLVCAMRDHAGRPFALSRFVDPEAEIVTHKTEFGRELRVLERPGLWNGAMALWNTVFVEVPIETFAPVKTVRDLLRNEHQPT